MAAYQEALKELTRSAAPLDWAMTQNNLGVALGTLGERESDSVRLKEAVAAFQEALKERTHSAVPLKWATTQNNLGNALHTLGQRESDSARLKEAMAAYQAALEEFQAAKASYYIDKAERNLVRTEALLQKWQTPP